MNKTKFVLTLLLMMGISLQTHAEDEDDLPVQSQTAIPSGPIEPVSPGTTAAIASDLSSRVRAFDVGTPNHTFRTVWVRMFPLIAVPYGDPYTVTHDTLHLSLHHDAQFTVFDGITHQLLYQGKDATFDFSKKTVTIDGHKNPLREFWITANDSAPLRLMWDKGNSAHQVGVDVRGGVMIAETKFANGSTHWSATNVLDLDLYLQSVVASEALVNWLPAALQAQAVAARTYALREISNARAAGRNWDLDPSTQYQSYRGQSYYSRSSKAWNVIEHDSTTAAVQATAGLGLLYNNEIIEAYFSANSGGTTCSASECFNQTDMPYLKAVPDAPGITGVAGGTWGQKANLTPATILRVLRSMGIKPRSPVRSLDALKVGESGRTWALQVRLASGVINLNSEQTGKMMSLFGAIRSHLFSLGSPTHGRQAVTGHGYGHGVGLCQWGAQLYAQAGWTADRILLYYYPGTVIKDLRAGIP